jgi:release factor glutamine methyltransferase
VSEATTVRRLLGGALSRLRGDEAVREAELLLQHVLQQPRAWLFAHGDDAVTAHVAEQFHSLLERRAAGEPLAYILGEREFWSLQLQVTPAVLIPRPETELLVEAALRHLPQKQHVDIADLGTGSGAIALALAHERPLARILAIDRSPAALVVAQANARRLELGHVEFLHSDWLAAAGGRRFDLIVSNPPYIAANDAHLRQGDLRFEPEAALASGADGLDAIRAIAGAAPEHLRPGGWLLFEHGQDQGRAGREVLAQNGFVEIFTERDLELRERVSGGRAPAAPSP